MKPKDLKSPFSFEERTPLLKDGVLYVPEYYDNHSAFGHLDWKVIFGNTNPVSIEFCSGNGEWIIQKAQDNPDTNWVAVELQFERVRKIYSKRHNLGINNLLIVCGEALTFARHYVADASVEQAYINFPDPWPKKRHAKHRLIKPPFPKELARIVTYRGGRSSRH